MSGIRLVVFDLGGVMVRIVRSWGDAHEAAGLEPERVPTSERFESERSRLAHAYQTGAVGTDDYFAAMADASGGAYTADEIRRVLHAWMYGEYEGVGRVVDALESAGVEMAALSNTNAYHWEMLRSDGPTPAFPTVARLKTAFASHVVGAAKPEAAIFEALERETDVSGESILFFDDVEPYVAAARKVGWRAERIDPAGDTAAQMLGHLKRYGVIGR